jgi:maleate isomerase
LRFRNRAWIRAARIEVVHTAGLGMTDNFGISSVTPTEIVTFAERELAGSPFDLLFVPCTNFRAVEARPLLQELLQCAGRDK